MFNSAAFSLINFKRDNVSNSFSPFDFLIVFREVFKKLLVLTPGIYNGYWKAKNIPF